VIGDRRSTSIEDLRDADVAHLSSIVRAVEVAELRARVADVLFVRKRHHEFGTIAIDGYIASAGVLITSGDRFAASERLARALVLGATMKNERERVATMVSTVLAERRGDDTYFSARLLGVLHELRMGDPALAVALAHKGRVRAFADREWHRAREYALILAQWQRRSGNQDGEQQARLAEVDCLVALADDAQQKMLEASFLAQAIQCLRSIAGTHARVAELHRRLLLAEQAAPSEFARQEGSLGLGDAPAKARERVSGHAFMDAVVRLACVHVPSSVDELRGKVMRAATASPLWYVISQQLANRRGHIIGVRGSLLDGPDEERESAIRHEMFARAREDRDYLVVSRIEPARAQVVAEHHCDYRSLVPLTNASPFVPAGREHVFARALAAGLNGDFLVALHLLIPQFEHAVRSLLGQRGTITSKIDASGIQDERDLGWLLTCSDAEQVFGADLLFEMRGLLIERFGGNLRNEVAHGLIDVDLMTAGQSIYFWWLALHMVVRPLLNFEASEPPSKDGEA
jgi:hypothetical protein